MLSKEEKNNLGRAVAARRVNSAALRAATG